MASKNTARAVGRSSKLEQWYAENRGLAWLLTSVIGIGAVLVALYVGILPHLKSDQDRQIENQVNASLKEPLEKVQNLRSDIAELKGEWEAIKPLLQSRVQENLKHSASLTPPEFEKALPILRATVLAASKAKIAAEPELVAQVGQRIIQIAAAKDEPSAWNVALRFLDYRSLLNAAFSPKSNGFGEMPVRWLIEPTLAYAKGVPVEAALKASPAKVPAEQAALFEFLNKPLNAGERFGPEYILLDGFTGGIAIRLDGHRVRNIIFHNSKVIYKGGPVEMENVYFVDCTFEFQLTPNGRSLSNEILVSNPTSFSVGG